MTATCRARLPSILVVLLTFILISADSASSEDNSYDEEDERDEEQGFSDEGDTSSPEEWSTGLWYDVPEQFPQSNTWHPPTVLCQTAAKINIRSERLVCKKGWTRFADKCYKAFDFSESAEAAHSQCERLEGDVSLASIHSHEENAIVQKVCGLRMCWLGLRRTPEEPESEWYWSDDTALDYENWGQNQPDNSGGADEAFLIMNLDPDISASMLWGFLWFCTFIGILISCFGGNCMLGAAHFMRGPMLERAKNGNPVTPPNCFWRYCCGASAVYYWEGCTGMVFLTCFCGHCCGAALCCWQPGYAPKIAGVPVGQPVQAGHQPVQYGHPISQATVVSAPMGSPGSGNPGMLVAVGQPVMGQPVAGTGPQGQKTVD